MGEPGIVSRESTFGPARRKHAQPRSRSGDGRLATRGTSEDWPTLELAPAATRTRVRAGQLALLAGLTALAAIVRLDATRGIWVDEAIGIREAHLPFERMLDVLRTTDFHPPLSFVPLWSSVHYLGDGELAVRLPSIIAGSLLVPMLFVAGRELYDARTGLVAAAFGAIAPLLVWYSQEARMYALVMLLAVVAVWAQARVLRRGDVTGWSLYTVAAALMLWTHYFTALQVLVQQLAFLVVAWHRARRGLESARLLLAYFGSLLVLAVAALPLLTFAREQVDRPGPEGFDILEPFPAQVSLAPSQADGLSIYRLFANAVWAIWGYHSGAVMSKLGALWPFAMLLALVLLGRRRSPPTVLLAAVGFIPPLLLAAMSFVQPEVFEVRYFAASIPILLLLLARAATISAASRAASAVVVGAVLTTLLVGLADQQLNTSNPRRYDFRSALTAIERRAGPRDVIVYAPRYLEDVVSYYAPALRRQPVTERLPSPNKGRRVFLVASFLDHPDVARRTGAAVWKLRRQGRLVGRIERHQVSTWVFR